MSAFKAVVPNMAGDPILTSQKCILKADAVESSKSNNGT